jgi:hypothetical protein
MLHCRLLTVLRFKQGQQIEARASSGKYWKNHARAKTHIKHWLWKWEKPVLPSSRVGRVPWSLGNEPLDPHWQFASFYLRSPTVPGIKAAPFPWFMWGVICTACGFSQRGTTDPPNGGVIQMFPEYATYRLLQSNLAPNDSIYHNSSRAVDFHWSKRGPLCLIGCSVNPTFQATVCWIWPTAAPNHVIKIAFTL